MKPTILDVIDSLKPCPFCGLLTNEGAETYLDSSAVWSGKNYSIISISIMHHCPRIEGQPSRRIERIGKDLESAVKAWNIRKG